MLTIFTKTRTHLDQQGETYFEHMLAAMTCALKLLYASFACAVHSFVPSLFTSTATQIASEVLSKRKNM